CLAARPRSFIPGAMSPTAVSFVLCRPWRRTGCFATSISCRYSAGGEHEWAHYLGSMLVDDVQKKLGAEVWVDSYDASGIEGMARFEKEIAGVSPDPASAPGRSRLYYAIGEQFGTGVFGKAVPWIRKNRQGEPFHAVRLYTLEDLRDALIAVTGKESEVRELFKGWRR
ncbi:MAG: hypothetical protein AB1486_33300, partial [Planctomycetota bacterium]